MNSQTEAVAKMAFDEGARQGLLLKGFMETQGAITEGVLEYMWDDAGEHVVEVLAENGNDVAARVLARRRQEAIEESLREP